MVRLRTAATVVPLSADSQHVAITPIGVARGCSEGRYTPMGFFSGVIYRGKLRGKNFFAGRGRVGGLSSSFSVCIDVASTRLLLE